MKIKAIAALCLAAPLALTGCMSGGGDSSSLNEDDFKNPTVGEVKAGSLSGTTMTFVSWGGEYQKGQDKAFSDPFAEASGAKVLSDGPTDVAKVKAQVEAGNVSWDVVNASPTINGANCGTLFEKLDLSLIDTSKLPESAVKGDCYLPSQAYVYGLFYDADKYGDTPPKGWADFFDTKKFPGKRGLDGRPSPTAGTYEAALLAEGVKKDDLFPLDTDKALNTYDKIKSDAVFWQTGAEQTQQVQSGEVDMIFGWSGRIFEANKNGANFKPVWTDGFLASDTFSIPTDAPNRMAAYAYINYALGAEQQKEMAELTSYSPVNVDAKPEFDEDAKKFDVSQPEILKQTIPQNGDYWGQNLDELNSTWADWLNG
ncbi:ABC transporter substrate-binding protein [Brevibacterium sp. 91QC2O2]|uniref:ABC transporter substrate-binding protein n=1 Tax=Brevibacterium sp. 91QC2O2 TaxID=2968458 RepID=UPI00211CBE96|nr:ABC transporter substrate-binding protein [Brevibacterium sp. 91QC2O2]MCQ9368828.1 ABC transporter substrate-binding protein [Brevibacterium sp. 91QC2O2]